MIKPDEETNESLPFSLHLARVLILAGQFATLIAIPLFTALKLLGVPGFGFRWRAIISFWALWFCVWMVGRFIGNTWLNRQIRDCIAKELLEEKKEHD